MRTSALVIIFTFFLSGLSAFFTNDDFFFLKISQVTSVLDFIRFFSPFSGPDGFGVYRPLTTQVYYAISANLFTFSPLPLRILSFILLLMVTWLVYKLSRKLTNDPRSSSLTAFFYLLSASHYAHLYYAAAFQELGLAFFVLLGLISLWTKPYFSVLFFFFSLLSKETAIVYPLLLLLVYFYSPPAKTRIGSRTGLVLLLLPHLLLLAIYAYFRIFHYGFAVGDSYVWQLSPQILNTLSWYALWSLNLPEMWVDFVGNGLSVNPNLFKYWFKETLVIFGLFLVFVADLFFSLANYLRTSVRSKLALVIFCLLWFVISLGPLLLLPWHKFTFYLTLPMFSVALILGQVLKNKLAFIVWILLFISVFSLTYRTNWISQSALVSKNVHNFLAPMAKLPSTVVFYDTKADSDLPWRPSQVVKVALSEQNYFSVYWPATRALYESQKPDTINGSGQELLIPARQFIGY